MQIIRGWGRWAMSAHCTRLDKIIEGLFICLPKFGSHFKSCHFGGLSQNFAAKILATYFGMPNCGNFFVTKKLPFRKVAIWGDLEKILLPKFWQVISACQILACQNLATFLAAISKVAIWGDLEIFLLMARKMSP